MRPAPLDRQAGADRIADRCTTRSSASSMTRAPARAFTDSQGSTTVYDAACDRPHRHRQQRHHHDLRCQWSQCRQRHDSPTTRSLVAIAIENAEVAFDNEPGDQDGDAGDTENCGPAFVSGALRFCRCPVAGKTSSTEHDDEGQFDPKLRGRHRLNKVIHFPPAFSGNAIPTAYAAATVCVALRAALLAVSATAGMLATVAAWLPSHQDHASQYSVRLARRRPCVTVRYMIATIKLLSVTRHHLTTTRIGDATARLTRWKPFISPRVFGPAPNPRQLLQHALLDDFVGEGQQ